MTCDECRAGLSTDPTILTRAERAVVNAHVLGCSSCYEWFQKVLAESEKAFTEEEKQRMGDLGLAITEEDLKDQEYLEIIEKAVRENDV